MCDDDAFKEWGIKDTSGVLYFENGVPNMYAGKKMEKMILPITF